MIALDIALNLEMRRLIKDALKAAVDPKEGRRLLSPIIQHLYKFYKKEVTIFQSQKSSSSSAPYIGVKKSVQGLFKVSK